MKKLIFISILSLIFMAAGAQRPTKSGSSNQRSNDGKKSETTVRRSSDQKNSTFDNRQNQSTRNTAYRTRTSSDNGNNSNNVRNSGSNRNASFKTGTNNGNDHGSGNNVTTRTIENRRSDLHKNLNSQKEITYESRRAQSASGRSENVYSHNQHANQRKVYQTPHRTSYYRKVQHVNRPRPIEYRRIYFAYRAPVYTRVVWTNHMYREYRLIYPEFRHWYYPVGYSIQTISAYDAGYYVGEVMNVYGKVSEVWYDNRSDEYFLHFGANFPYHDFTVIIKGNTARHFARQPEFFFENRYIWVTGLISLYDNKPEMVVKKIHQVHPY